jgi:predicted nuclease of predicted toxin-antitoxin system
LKRSGHIIYLASRAENAARLLWVRLGNCRTSALIEAFDRLWPRIEQALLSGERVVEIR